MTSITLEWQAPGDDGATPITDYEVQMDSGDGLGFIPIGKTGSGSSTTFLQEGLTAGADYFFLVVAENIVGWGPDSTATKITAGMEPDQPPVPVMTSRSSSSVAFSFEAPISRGESPIIGYKIMWNGGSGSAFSTLTTITENLDDLSFSKNNNILGGITYEFKVIAVNIVGDSVASPAVSILAA
jgi:hypothetical protein